MNQNWFLRSYWLELPGENGKRHFLDRYRKLRGVAPHRHSVMHRRTQTNLSEYHRRPPSRSASLTATMEWKQKRRAETGTERLSVNSEASTGCAYRYRRRRRRELYSSEKKRTYIEKARERQRKSISKHYAKVKLTTGWHYLAVIACSLSCFFSVASDGDAVGNSSNSNSSYNNNAKMSIHATS